MTEQQYWNYRMDNRFYSTDLSKIGQFFISTSKESSYDNHIQSIRRIFMLYECSANLTFVVSFVFSITVKLVTMLTFNEFCPNIQIARVELHFFYLELVEGRNLNAVWNISGNVQSTSRFQCNLYPNTSPP